MPQKLREKKSEPEGRQRKITVMVDQSLFNQAVASADAVGETLSLLVRKAIMNYLEDQQAAHPATGGKSLPPQKGRFPKREGNN